MGTVFNSTPGVAMMGWDTEDAVWWLVAVVLPLPFKCAWTTDPDVVVPDAVQAGCVQRGTTECETAAVGEKLGKITLLVATGRFPIATPRILR